MEVSSLIGGRLGPCDRRLQGHARATVALDLADLARCAGRCTGDGRSLGRAGTGNPYRCSHVRSTSGLIPVSAATAPIVKSSCDVATARSVLGRDEQRAGSRDLDDERVDDVLRCFVEEQAKALSGLDGRLDALTVEVADLVAAGGKRLRPAFVYWGHRAAGGGDEQAADHVGAAVEMLHTFALLHDDVMDRADTRRGRAAAAHAFTQQASERGSCRPGAGSARAQQSWPAIWPSSGRIACSTPRPSERPQLPGFGRSSPRCASR